MLKKARVGGFRKKKNSSKSLKGSMQVQEMTEADLLLPSMSFDECPSTERPALLIRKLRLCQVCFDFRMPATAMEEKARIAKRNELMELVEYIGSTKNIFDGDEGLMALTELVDLIGDNIFRPLPPKDTTNITTPDLDDEEMVEDPSWAHLQIVYELFLRFIVSGDVEIEVLGQYVNEGFVGRMLDVFATQDRRERDYLKIILHRIYAKIMCLRTHIRKLLTDSFQDFLNNPTTTSNTGIAELLEVMAAIINGYVTPLKPEHIDFLHNTLIPLHKASFYKLFDRQLSYCVTQFVEKDKSLAESVVKGIIRYWPLCNSHKEMSFLEEFEDVLELLPADSFSKLMVPICRVLAHAISTPHFQVTERVLYLWHNETIVAHVARHIDIALPILFPALQKHAEAHWNPSIHNLALNVLKIFLEIDPVIMEKVTSEFDEKKATAEARIAQKNARWKELEQQAKQAGISVS